MTLIEAVKSGKPFKRPIHDLGYLVVSESGIIEWNNGRQMFISKESLLANDWIVIEQNASQKELNNILMFRKRK